MRSLVLSLALAAVASFTAARQDGAASQPQSRPGVTFGLSEAEFMALHQLKADKAPPLRGSAVDVGGAACYLSLPKDGKPPFPAVVVIHEWWGLNDHIKHWADRLAADGCAALAVDLYGGKVAKDATEAMAAMKAVDESKALATLKAAHAFLVKDPRVAARKTASIGWCFGGGWSLQLALAEPELDAAVIYYGRLESDPKRLAALKSCAVLGVFGTKDRSPSPAMVDDFEKGLTAAGIRHEIRRYDANHAFANPSGANYDTKNAADAWEHVRALLARELKG